MTRWIQQVMDSLGYPGIALLMFLENIFPPLPSELIMPLAGFATSDGGLSFVGVVAAGTLGSVAGAFPLYYLGKIVGQERLISWTDRYGRWFAMSGTDIIRSRDWFDRHGRYTILVCRLVPGVRSLISIPAGVAAMRLLPFLIYSVIGAGLWTALLAYAGQLLGENYGRVNTLLGPATYVVIGVLLVMIAGWILRRKRRSK